MRNGVSSWNYLTDVAFPSHMYVENQSNSIWLKSKMSLIECAFYSPSTLHPFNWCEWIVSSFVRYRREFREFHIDTGIYYYYYFFHSKYSLFIIYWLVWLKSHIFAQRSKEREKAKQSSSSSSNSKTIILSTFHHLFPDFLYSFLLPHETHFSLFTFHTKSESIYTFTVANLLIVCWNSDESITCAHSVPHTYTQPNQKKCNTRQYYSLAILIHRFLVWSSGYCFYIPAFHVPVSVSVSEILYKWIFHSQYLQFLYIDDKIFSFITNGQEKK